MPFRLSLQGAYCCHHWVYVPRKVDDSYSATTAPWRGAAFFHALLLKTPRVDHAFTMFSLWVFGSSQRTGVEGCRRQMNQDEPHEFPHESPVTATISSWL